MKDKIISTLGKLCVVKSHAIFITSFFLFILIKILLEYDRDLRHWIVEMGDIFQIVIPLYVVVPVIWKRDIKGLKQMLKIFLIVLGITWTFKLGLSELVGIHHIRPSGGSMSFPSGHTAAAFSGAIFLSIRYGWKYFMISVPLAFFVGWSRIYGNAHWPSDVITSIFLCITAGLFLVNRHKVDTYL